MLRVRDPHDAEFGEWWEVPGGGIEPGEDSVAAAVRETAEETGCVVATELVGPVCWTGDITFVWADVREWASVVMHLARIERLESSRPVCLTSGEKGAFLAQCWLTAPELVGERTVPSGLATDLPRMLAGERVDAGFRVWN